MFKALLKTNPSLTGNITLGCNLDNVEKVDNHNYKAFVRSASLLPLQNQYYNKYIDVNLIEGSWEFDVAKFYKYYSDVFYNDNFIYNKNDYKLLDIYAEDEEDLYNRNKSFEFGCKRGQVSKYGHQFLFYAPIYVDDIDSIPNYFEIHLTIGNGIYKDIKIYIGKQEDRNYLRNYLRKYLYKIDHNVIYCMNDSNQAMYYGIDVINGGFKNITDNQFAQLYNWQTTINMFDQVINDGFNRNKLIIKQIIPLTFLFDVEQFLEPLEEYWFTNKKIKISGNYIYDNVESTMYDFVDDYKDFHISYRKYNEYLGEFQLIRYADNIMLKDDPSLMESVLYDNLYINKFTKMFNRWKMFGTTDNYPYILNNSSAFTINSTNTNGIRETKYIYGDFPIIDMQNEVYGYVENNDLILINNYKNYKAYLDYTDVTNINNYIYLMNNNISNWFNIYGSSIQENIIKDIWVDNYNTHIYYNGILYNFYLLFKNGLTFDKFAMFINPVLFDVKDNKIYNVNYAIDFNSTLYNVSVNENFLNYIYNDDIVKYGIANNNASANRLFNIGANVEYNGYITTNKKFIDTYNKELDIENLSANDYIKIENIDDYSKYVEYTDELDAIIKELDIEKNVSIYVIDGYEKLPFNYLSNICDDNETKNIIAQNFLNSNIYLSLSYTTEKTSILNYINANALESLPKSDPISLYYTKKFIQYDVLVAQINDIDDDNKTKNLSEYLSACIQYKFIPYQSNDNGTISLEFFQKIETYYIDGSNKFKEQFYIDIYNLEETIYRKILEDHIDEVLTIEKVRELYQEYFDSIDPNIKEMFVEFTDIDEIEEYMKYFNSNYYDYMDSLISCLDEFENIIRNLTTGKFYQQPNLNGGRDVIYRYYDKAVSDYINIFIIGNGPYVFPDLLEEISIYKINGEHVDIDWELINLVIEFGQKSSFVSTFTTYAVSGHAIDNYKTLVNVYNNIIRNYNSLFIELYKHGNQDYFNRIFVKNKGYIINDNGELDVYDTFILCSYNLEHINNSSSTVGNFQYDPYNDDNKEYINLYYKITVAPVNDKILELMNYYKDCDSENINPLFIYKTKEIDSSVEKYEDIKSVYGNNIKIYHNTRDYPVCNFEDGDTIIEVDNIVLTPMFELDYDIADYKSKIKDIFDNSLSDSDTQYLDNEIDMIINVTDKLDENGNTYKDQIESLYYTIYTNILNNYFLSDIDNKINNMFRFYIDIDYVDNIGNNFISNFNTVLEYAISNFETYEYIDLLALFNKEYNENTLYTNSLQTNAIYAFINNLINIINCLQFTDDQKQQMKDDLLSDTVINDIKNNIFLQYKKISVLYDTAVYESLVNTLIYNILKYFSPIHYFKEIKNGIYFKEDTNANIYNEEFSLNIYEENGIKYGYYLADYYFTNDENSFNLYENSFITTKILSINGSLISDSTINEYFKQIVPYLNDNIFYEVLNTLTTIITPTRFKIKRTNEIEKIAQFMDAQYKLVPITTTRYIYLNRYFDYIEPYITENNGIVTNVYQLKFKDPEHNHIYNSDIMYCENININKYNGLRVYDENDNTKYKIVYQYEYKHYNDSNLYFLERLITLRYNKIVNMDEINLITEKDEATIAKYDELQILYLQNYINKKNNTKMDKSEILFLINKYNISIKIEEVDKNYIVSRKKFILKFIYELK